MTTNRISPLALLLMSLAAAQTQTLQIPFYGYDTIPIDASIVDVSNAATTMALACKPGTDASDCGLFPAQTLTYGPSTYQMYMAEGTETAAFLGTQGCSRAGTTSAVCTESDGGSEANFPGVSTSTYEGEDVVVMAVTVTGGAEKLAGTQATAMATGSSGMASATASGSESVMTLSGTGTGTGTASESSASQTASATGSAAASSSSSAAAPLCEMGAGVLALVAGALGYALL